MAAFLQDSLAIVVIEGLLDQIKMIKRQRVTVLEHIERAEKHKAPVYKEPMVEPKQARAPARQPQPPPPPVQPLSLLATSISVCSDSWRVIGSLTSSYALDVLGPTKHHRGQKPPLDMSKLDIVDFPDNVPAQAGPAQLLFMHTVLIPAPPPQFAVVVLTTDPRMLEQYDGLVATQQKTAAASKGKGKAVAMVDNESDYGQSLSEDKQKLEEGESAAQRFQHVQQNKRLTMKKANVAKARDAQQHWAINDFSGRISNGLGVKV
ncbi:hypothetical protein C0995_011764, partial [Termitomyces sp. Mi166